MDVHTKYYSDSWKDTDSLLIYHNNNFQFSTNIIVVELDDCITKYIPNSHLYNTINPRQIEILDPNFIRALQKEERSIVMLSNAVANNSLNYNTIKKKLEGALAIIRIPILAIFALQPNKFMKPHTGLFKFLKMYYASIGQTRINHTLVVGNLGGCITEKERKGIVHTRAVSDVDRAFAHNIDADYQTVGDFIGDKPQSFKWDPAIIPPEVRDVYRDKLLTINNVDILQLIHEFKKSEMYVIMIMGAPRCGKTSLAKKILDLWKNDPLNKTHCIRRLGEQYTKRSLYTTFCKLITDRISVIIDGNCHTDKLRAPFLEFLKNKDVPVLYIDVTVGIEMAKVFNHVAVEDATEASVHLYKRIDYDIYRGVYKIPRVDSMSKFIYYYPRIEETDAVMLKRY